MKISALDPLSTGFNLSADLLALVHGGKTWKVAPLDLFPKVDGNYLPLTGGTLTGPLTAVATTTPVSIREVGYTAALPAWPIGTMLGVARETGNLRAQLITAGGANLILGYAAEGTMSAPTATQINRQMLSLQGGGFDGSAWATASSIQSLATGPWTTGSHPSALVFLTTAAGTTTNLERMRLSDVSQLLTVPVMINASTAPAPTLDNGTYLNVRSPDGINSRILIDAIGGTPGLPINAAVIGRRALGTASAPTALTADIVMLAIGTYGHGGAGFTNTRGTSIEMLASENWNSLAQGTYMRFLTTPPGTNTQHEVARITADQTLLVGKTTSAGLFNMEVSGGSLLDTIRLNTATGPTVTAGNGAPAATAPAGSIYVRQDGAAGTRVYVNQNGAATWAAIAGV